MPLSPKDKAYAQVLWDYMFLRDELQPADVIIGLGCHDLTVADDVADLYHLKIAPVVVFTGDVGRMSVGMFEHPEAQMLKQRAMSLGVSEHAIILEQTATNTGENIVESQHILEGNGLREARIVIVHKQYMLRRDYATFMKQWRGAKNTDVSFWAKDISMDEFLANSEFDSVETINVMVGDFQRILVYPSLGYQVELPVPDSVRAAYAYLVERGFSRHLTSENVQ